MTDHDLKELKNKWKKEILKKINNIDDTESVTIEDKEKKIKVKAETCIYRVPDKLQRANEDAYHPRLVSIGPYHRHNPNLVPMDKIKLDYMTSFLDRHPDGPEVADPEQCLKKCIDTIYCSKELLQVAVPICYAEELKNKDNKELADKERADKELADIMLFDGCFILELFLKYDHRSKNMNSKDNESDPLLRSCWRMEALRHDLALLENQIPFFILQLLYEVIKPFVDKCEPPSSVASLALKFFQPAIGKEEIKEVSTATDLKHLLDLLHKSYFPPTVLSPQVPKVIPCPCSNISIAILSNTQSPESQNKKWGFNYSASELLESGIDFRVASEEQNLMKISFKEGVITIPQLCITDTTSSLFRNLIAYEQCSIRSEHRVTSYAFFMNRLVNSPRDSKLLQDKKIIKHNREDRNFLTEFKSIVDEAVVKDDFYFGPLFDQVNVYRQSWCHFRRLLVFIREKSKKQKLILCKTYFSSTWKLISLIAAVFLLFLTSLQTYFTIYPRS